MDRSTITNLELLQTLQDHQRTGSLLSVIDQTSTAMGGRLLKQWLLQPLAQVSAIDQRLTAVAYWLSQSTERAHWRSLLSQLPDLERLLSRLSLGVGTPRDLSSVERCLAIIEELGHQLTAEAPLLLKGYREQLTHASLSTAAELIRQHLVDIPAFDPRSGGLIKAGVNPELDALRHRVTHSREWLAELEATERERTGISSLKIKFNQVFGFYIEISKANLHLVPPEYHRKQTLVNAERFMTAELKEHEDIILTAQEKINQLEFEIFTDLVNQVLAHLSPLQQAARAIASCDCLLCFSQVAEDYHYHRPQVTEDREILITGGRHPVVEQVVASHRFVPNDVKLNDQQQLLLITGPNMAGKSVFMRQVGLITLLAHMGSFVPAQSAVISLTDQIFVRSGAADMITAGLSTFMVEMVETSRILKQATAKSLVIMDEIGRGTSTYDGISIAWAVAEFLVTHHQPGPKTLFATHYHELQELAEKFPHQIVNFHLGITQHQGKPVFLYTLQPGGASHSFGVAVAELAGIPRAVVDRASELLRGLELHHQLAAASASDSSVPAPSNSSWENSLATKMKTVDLNTLTPLAALNLLATWKQEVESVKD